MKFYVAIFCAIFVLVQSNESFLPEYMSSLIRDKCHKKIGIGDKELENLRRGEFNKTTHDQMCYLKCTLNELTIMDENGDLTPEEAVKLLPPVLIKDVTEIADVCGEIEEEDSCVKAMKMYKCLFDNFPEVYFVP